MAGRTLFDKIWDAHAVADLGGGFFLLHIDRTLLHDLSGAGSRQDVLEIDIGPGDPHRDVTGTQLVVRRTIDLFEQYVRKIAPKTVELKITRLHGGKPWMTAFDNKFVRAAGRAIEQGFGKPPVFVREGGSIPVVATFERELGIPAVLFGVGLPDENAHAPDEKLDLGNFHNGIIASAFLYQEIANT